MLSIDPHPSAWDDYTESFDIGEQDEPRLQWLENSGQRISDIGVEMVSKSPK